jgi:hypothetical protein
VKPFRKTGFQTGFQFWSSRKGVLDLVMFSIVAQLIISASQKPQPGFAGRSPAPCGGGSSF